MKIPLEILNPINDPNTCEDILYFKKLIKEFITATGKPGKSLKTKTLTNSYFFIFLKKLLLKNLILDLNETFCKKIIFKVDPNVLEITQTNKAKNGLNKIIETIKDNDPNPKKKI